MPVLGFNVQLLSKGLYWTFKRLLKAPAVVSRRRRPLLSRSSRDLELSNSGSKASALRVESTGYKFDINVLYADLSYRKTPDAAASAVILTDSVAQFSDLLDTLYQVLDHVELETSDIEQLLDIAEVAHEHNLSSWVSCALQRICSFVNDPKSSFRPASADLYTRILALSTLCHHHDLTNAVSRILIINILWYNFLPDSSLLSVAKARGLRRLCGVTYYRQLTRMPQTAAESPIGRMGLVFSSSTDVETRMRFLAAHHSLSKLWEHIQRSPPSLHCDGCPSHPTCIATWRQMWLHASHSKRVVRIGPADVLGRLKAMLVLLRRMTSASPTMNIQCSLAALEAVGALRDDIIEHLVEHFTYC